MPSPAEDRKWQNAISKAQTKVKVLKDGLDQVILAGEEVYIRIARDNWLAAQRELEKLTKGRGLTRSLEQNASIADSVITKLGIGMGAIALGQAGSASLPGVHQVFDKSRLGSTAKALGSTLFDSVEYSTFSGADIKCAVYVPPQTIPTGVKAGGGFKTFAELQTISISSARSVDPGRILGSAKAQGYTRGGRTIAGTLIFTDIVRDAFSEILSVNPRYENTDKYEFFVDQIPPFNIIITANNEYGVSATRVIVGVTLVNYGTTYSIDNMLTESTYTYVADSLTPFMERTAWTDYVQKIINMTAQRRYYGSRASRLRASVAFMSQAPGSGPVMR